MMALQSISFGDKILFTLNNKRCGLLFCCPRETVYVLFGIFLQSHIEDNSPHLLPYKLWSWRSSVPSVNFYCGLLFCCPRETVCVFPGKLLQFHIEDNSPHLLPYKLWNWRSSVLSVNDNWWYTTFLIFN